MNFKMTMQGQNHKGEPVTYSAFAYNVADFKEAREKLQTPFRKGVLRKYRMNASASAARIEQVNEMGLTEAEEEAQASQAPAHDWLKKGWYGTIGRAYENRHKAVL